ncbi:MAG: Gx transporter family protein [Sphaerochaetaceae bacterium]|nr:Gx transporter family protein [Sphaerochaetaceae bacterium]
METRKIAQMGLLIALAMILSYVESRIPAFVAIPGIKMGLANIVVVFALYRLGFKEALVITALRVVLASLLFGSVLSMAYSASGALLSLVGMTLLKKSRLFGTVAVSVTGGVLHNLGQIATACLILETNAIAYYIPFLIISGVVTGIVIGLAAAIVINRLDPDRKVKDDEEDDEEGV